MLLLECQASPGEAPNIHNIRGKHPNNLHGWPARQAGMEPVMAKENMLAWLFLATLLALRLTVSVALVGPSVLS
ncbi:MAG TPA: hypothetical protein DDZ53_03730 [Firmicutes bacterium]|nr:hypothetical protein [Bacillota bacterium]